MIGSQYRNRQWGTERVAVDVTDAGTRQSQGSLGQGYLLMGVKRGVREHTGYEKDEDYGDILCTGF